MKKYHFALVGLLMLFSCSKEKNTSTSETFNDPNWIRIELPNNRSAHAIYGSIEDTLLVSTIYDNYQITDNGKTLTKTEKKFYQPAFGFVKSNDTLYALMANHLKDTDGLRFASYAQYHSLNNGMTWNWTELHKNKVELKQKFEEVAVDDNLKFSIKENIEYFPQSTTDGLILKSDLRVSRNGSTSILELPFDNQITSLHLDKHGKLYISANSGLYDSKTKKYRTEEKRNVALVYISKKPAKDLFAR